MYARILAVFILVVPCLAIGGGPIREIENGFWIGNGKSADNKEVYFAMERVDKSNIEMWRAYASQTKDLTKRSGSLFAQLLAQCEKEIPSFKKDIKEATGFTEKEFISFVEKLQSNGFCSLKGKDSILRLDIGINEFKIDDNGQYYVAYVSKKPIKVRFIEAVKLGVDSLTLKSFLDSYSDLLISVRSNYNGSPVFANRGIFRSLTAMIDAPNEYKGLSVPLHAFTSAVMQEISNGSAHYLAVAPARSMRNILLKSISPKFMFFCGLSAKDIPKDLPFAPQDYGCLHYTKNNINFLVKEEHATVSFAKKKTIPANVVFAQGFEWPNGAIAQEELFLISMKYLNVLYQHN